MMQYVWIFFTAFFAFSAGRSIIAWTIGAYFFGWVALLAVVLLPRKEEAFNRKVQKINEWSENKVIKEEVGDFNTVDDLFKQLETK